MKGEEAINSRVEDRLERSNWRSKTKELILLETQFAMCGRDARSLSKRKPSAATQIKYLQLAANHWMVATMQSRRDSKVMTWNRRKPPNAISASKTTDRHPTPDLVQSSSLVTVRLHRLNFYVVLRIPIPKLQAFS